MPANALKNTFEPRVGTAQLIFGVIYALVTAIAAVLAYHVYTATGRQPLTQYFFMALFAIMTAKSFYLYAHTKRLVEHGEHTTGMVDEVVFVRGITYVRGRIRLSEDLELPIENRLAGEQICHELKHYLQTLPQPELPGLIVDRSRHPRGMFLIKTLQGHLDVDFLTAHSSDKGNI
ncbi:MAG: hypothetical protein K6F05_05775 [Succinivibrio sp.]|nr:hypothetical protein [Succinivibrio sp.]